MQHKDIWRGLDQLAAHHGLSASGLAKRAGLDPTSFNPSKRAGADGRPRWPTTESLARVLDAVGAGFDDFAALVEGRGGGSAPLIDFAQAGQNGFFDDAGFPVGAGWDDARFPGLGAETVYALQISDGSMEPAYRAGDRIIVAPGTGVKPGDRVVAKTAQGEVMAKVLVRKNARVIKLAPLHTDYPSREFRPSEIAWIARILWASQ